MESVEQLNIRFKALKQGLLSEKEQRKEKGKILEDVKRKIRELQEREAELVGFIQDLVVERKEKEREAAFEELSKAQDQLKVAKAKANPLKKSFGTSRSMMALQAQNEKLVEEYAGLRDEHRQDEEFILIKKG